MAASALSYGPHVSNPRPGDLVVMRTRRGAAGHVGIVVGVEPDGSIEIVSGNWSHHVARAVISRRSVTAFVRP
jgi:cell wall-associated NlpC family hydrolase